MELSDFTLHLPFPLEKILQKIYDKEIQYISFI